jgi:LAS superfamily LD-carboxypeptidase LdcB
MINQLLGKSEAHLEYLADQGTSLHKDAVKSFREWQTLAEKETGIKLCLASAYRNNERQSLIWNEKAQGKREVWDHEGKALLKMNALSDEEKMWAILRWSAIPGFSRHHWGTDFDIYDGNKISKEKLKLIPEEYESKQSPMLDLHLWLNEQIVKTKAQIFYRPYEQDRGGIAREPWHLSFRPLAYQYEKMLDLDLFRNEIFHSDILLRNEILQNSQKIFEKYILN